MVYFCVFGRNLKIGFEKADRVGDIFFRMAADFPFDCEKAVISDFAERFAVLVPVHLSLAEFHFPEELSGFRNKLIESAFSEGIVNSFRVAVLKMNSVFCMGVHDVFSQQPDCGGRIGILNHDQVRGIHVHSDIFVIDIKQKLIQLFRGFGTGFDGKHHSVVCGKGSDRLERFDNFRIQF